MLDMCKICEIDFVAYFRLHIYVSQNRKIPHVPIVLSGSFYRNMKSVCHILTIHDKYR